MRETTREPHSNCVQIGDVAFIHEGHLYLLFSARSPLGGRRLGIDVPNTFKQLDIEEIDECDPLAAGYFCTNGVRASSSSPPLPCVRSIPFISSSTSGLNFSRSGSASTISFDLTGEKGAILLAKDPIYRENAQRWGAFDTYVKEHYASWVAFARKNRYGDVDPVLITGVDRTKDWAMLCYSNNTEVLKCKFRTLIPPAPVWGTWDKPGFIHAKSGPQSCRPPSGSGLTETVSDEYNQCIFIRYWNLCKRSWVPKIMKAAAGPHILGRRGRNGEGSPLEAHYDLDSASDNTSGSSGGFEDDDGSSLTSIDAESDDMTHDTTTVRIPSFPLPLSSILTATFRTKGMIST